MKCNLVFDAATGLSWTVRTVEAGDTHGLNNALTFTGDVPLVEFYDVRYKHTEFGQFVSRYNLDLLLALEGGIQLDGGVPEWRLSADAAQTVLAWLKAEYPEVEALKFIF